MSASRISVSHDTRKLLESLKTSGETYDDVIRGLIVSHPHRTDAAELARRVRHGERHSIDELIKKSRQRPY